MARIIHTIRRQQPNAVTKKRVAAYARVSSGKEAMLHSLATQVQYYSEHIQRNAEWEYAGVYADEAVTGTKDQRTDFQRLISDCRAGKVDVVITKSISRFARNTLTLLEVVRELKGIGVDVYFEQENIHSMSGDGELMLTVLASFAQEESLSVSENCKWRIRKQYENGELVNLRFLYGYHITNSMIRVNPDEAEIVQMIFEQYAQGIGATTIARKLAAMEIPRPRDGIWTSERVIQIIRNEKYMGDALYQKKYVVDHLTKQVRVNRGELPQYFVQSSHPPIVSKDLFERANAVLQSRSETEGIPRSIKQYPFTSKILCGKCGKNYKRKMCRGKVYWACSTSLRYGKSKCHAKQIPEDILIELTLNVLGKDAFDSDYFRSEVMCIRCPSSDRLEFVLKDGAIIAKGWQNKSRRESWGQEDRKKARERQQLMQKEGGQHVCEKSRHSYSGKSVWKSFVK